MKWNEFVWLQTRIELKFEMVRTELRNKWTNERMDTFLFFSGIWVRIGIVPIVLIWRKWELNENEKIGRRTNQHSFNVAVCFALLNQVMCGVDQIK